MTKCDYDLQRLVDFADGVHSENEADAASTAAHIARCFECATRIQKLSDSLTIAQSVWNENTATASSVETDTPLAPDHSQAHKSRFGRALLPVATLAAAAALAFCFLPRGEYASTTSQTSAIEQADIATVTPTSEPDIEAIEAHIERCGLAAQLLASADLLAQQPGGEAYALERYILIKDRFAGSPESKSAAAKLQSINQL